MLACRLVKSHQSFVELGYAVHHNVPQQFHSLRCLTLWYLNARPTINDVPFATSVTRPDSFMPVSYVDANAKNHYDCHWWRHRWRANLAESRHVSANQWVIFRLSSKAPSTPAPMSKQRSKQRLCCQKRQQCRTNLSYNFVLSTKSKQIEWACSISVQFVERVVRLVVK